MKQELKIDKNVKVPKPSSGRWLSRFGPILENMEVGDSLLLENSFEYYAFVRAGNRRGFKMTSRREGLGRRIWITSFSNKLKK